MPYKDKNKQREAEERRQQSLRESDPAIMERYKKRQKEASARHYSSNKQAKNEQSRQWYAENKERHRELVRRNAGSIPAEDYERYLEGRRRDKADYMARWKYTEAGLRFSAKKTIDKKFKAMGLTIEGYEHMYAQQGGKCAVCMEPGLKWGQKRMHIDHCHKTNRVRALLCNHCNRGISGMRERPEIFYAALAYLEKHRKTS